MHGRQLMFQLPNTHVDNEDTDDRLFPLLFMVLGSAHHSEMQSHLESTKRNLSKILSYGRM